MGGLGYVVGGALLGLLMAIYAMMALGTPILAGALGYFAARRASCTCVARAGITALFAVGVPLAASGIAKNYLAQGFIRSLMLSSALLLQLPTILFDGMYDRKVYSGHALAASAAVIFAIIWLIGAAICAWQTRRARERQRR